MASITLGDARKLLSRYAGAGNSFTDRINEVQSRLLPYCTPKGSKVRLRYAVYRDRHRQPFITTPNGIENVLGGVYSPVCDGTTDPNLVQRCFSDPIPVRNGWYEFASGGPGAECCSDSAKGIILLEGQFTTFADWNEPRRLRIVPERDESPGGKIIFRGYHNGAKIFSLDGGNWIEGLAVDFTSTSVTTTQEFDEPPYQVIKPVTKGRVLIGSVDANDVTLEVAFYEPSETSPAYARYKVPICPTPDNTEFFSAGPTSDAFITLCKKSFKPAFDENDELIVGNIGALKAGLMALLKEDASDTDRAGQYLAAAIQYVTSENENSIGASAQGVVQMDDSFLMEAFPVGL